MLILPPPSGVGNLEEVVETLSKAVSTGQPSLSRLVTRIELGRSLARADRIMKSKSQNCPDETIHTLERSLSLEVIRTPLPDPDGDWVANAVGDCLVGTITFAPVK